MNKFLLPAVVLAFTASTAMANEHTLVFDGENDMYGLTRQTTTDVNSLEFVPEISFTEAGINFKLTKTSESGKGFALVNAGGTNAGIMVYAGFGSATFQSPEISLTVPGGKITAATLYLSGSALVSQDISFNGTEVGSESEGSLYYWEWKNSDGVETLNMQWNNNYYARYIHSIELTYTEDLGGKKECGLSYSIKDVEAILGEPFTSPWLSNPNKLPVTYTSSNESVATVDDKGKVTLLSGGKTDIIVSTVGNEEFAPGNTRYELTVIPVATTLVQMKEVAPALYDRVKVNCPLTVTFANGSYAFVTDAEGNAGCVDDLRNKGNESSASQTIYSVGQVIPAGWIATNGTIYESVIWEGLPANSTETVDVVYPHVASVTPADADRVVVLDNVTFTTPTPSGNTKGYGTTADGTRYEFQDTYGAPQLQAGTYDVTAVVRYSKRGSTEYFYLAPLSYVVSVPSAIESIEAAGAAARYYNLQGTEVESPRGGVYVKVADGKASKVIVK